jgi:nucleoside-diphosphate-sugar epimerase
MSATKQSYLVIGGCGFLGRHIVETLLARGEQAVAVFDLVQRHHDKNVQFFTGDMCEAADLNKAIKQVCISIRNIPVVDLPFAVFAEWCDDHFPYGVTDDGRQ